MLTKQFRSLEHSPLYASTGPPPQWASFSSFSDEERRLAALRSYGVLDSSREQAFDEIAALAGELFGTPVALVSLLDRDRQWFKARVGLDMPEIPRELAFCAHALKCPSEVMVVPDAHQDPRFASNPLVTADPGLRFYAGALMITPEGLVLGSVCVLSPEPRPDGLTPMEQQRLRRLAAMGMAVLETRRQAHQAAQDAARAEARQASEERLRLALDVTGGCAWELDPVSGVSVWDLAARDLLGVPDQAPIAEALAAFVHPDDLVQVRTAMSTALDPDGDGRYAVEHRAATNQRHHDMADDRWFQSLGQAWFEEARGARVPVRMVCVTMDVTERRAAQQRQSLLVAELNHRVKNTLAVVLAISTLTRRPMEGAAGSERVPSGVERRRFHTDFMARLLALARAHDVLTLAGWRGAEMSKVVDSALAPYHVPDATPGRITTTGPALQLAPEPAVALAMVLHELATNAAKYGGLSTPAGSVAVSWYVDPEPGELHLCWTEMGGPVTAPPQQRGFGSRMLEATIRQQLGGRLVISWGPDGLSCRMVVPAVRVLSARVLSPQAYQAAAERHNTASAGSYGPGQAIL